ncbi:hypothetical protein NQ318_011438 [Aromia moschata]|uniref:Uncharacterized protein n=1 Tax=Aromia moschata TaxID=1265417 RepID=A0AAV8YUT4_9CUCU|nr:hypothetical protein NQ318_011438 [Aromia moschata]
MEWKCLWCGIAADRLSMDWLFSHLDPEKIPFPDTYKIQASLETPVKKYVGEWEIKKKCKNVACNLQAL